MLQNQPTIAPQPGIMEIALYQSGASKVAGIENVVKLSSNENPFGPSDKAREAAHRFYRRIGFSQSHEGFKLVL